MPIPAPNLNPPFNIVRLSHVELKVTDLAWSRRFYVDTLGLQITFEDGDHIYLRAMEERGHHCVILKKAAEPSVGVLGFKVWSEDDLDKAEAMYRGLIDHARASFTAFYHLIQVYKSESSPEFTISIEISYEQ